MDKKVRIALKQLLSALEEAADVKGNSIAELNAYADVKGNSIAELNAYFVMEQQVQNAANTCAQIVLGAKKGREKNMTNDDRIRKMSNEELAVTLTCPNEMGMAEIKCNHSDDENCCRCLLNWLNQQEEEDKLCKPHQK